MIMAVCTVKEVLQNWDGEGKWKITGDRIADWLWREELGWILSLLFS